MAILVYFVVMRKAGAAVGTYGTVSKKLTAKEDLKMSDLLRYYQDDSLAARELLVRRVKAYKEMLRTDKELEKAKTKGKNVIVNQEANENGRLNCLFRCALLLAGTDVTSVAGTLALYAIRLYILHAEWRLRRELKHYVAGLCAAPVLSQTAKTTYEKITKSAETELQTFQKRRMAAFRKGLIQYTQCQIRQSRVRAIWGCTRHYIICYLSSCAAFVLSTDCAESTHPPHTPKKRHTNSRGATKGSVALCTLHY